VKVTAAFDFDVNDKNLTQGCDDYNMLENDVEIAVSICNCIKKSAEEIKRCSISE